jgi:hypothetical protein
MNTKLVIGQNVYVDGGFGPVEAKVVEIASPCVYVETGTYGQLRFNENGEECGSDGNAYTYENNPMIGPGPWELKSVDEVHLARNVSSWLIKYLKSGEKPMDEILKEAEKEFGNAIGDVVCQALRNLLVLKRQENECWYWSMRWNLDENNVVRRSQSRCSFLTRGPW